MQRNSIPQTLLIVGDRIDYDAYLKFIRERKKLRREGFRCERLSYNRLLNGSFPNIRTKRVLVFLFFPHNYWNKHIEQKQYRGIYGNRFFYEKFLRFMKEVRKILVKKLKGKEVRFVNAPEPSALYRDKLFVAKQLSKRRIPMPKLYTTRSMRRVDHLIKRGSDLYIKVRYGSMGKGITYVSPSQCLTNFTYRDGRILSRKSDRGWKFRNVEARRPFVNTLLKKDILVEEAIHSLPVRKKRFDLRVYVFFNKPLYVYPKVNAYQEVTTNISQGAKGARQSFLKDIPKHLIVRTKNLASKTTRALGLNFAGVDVIISAEPKGPYVVDVNVFPGFPKRQMCNLARHLVQELGYIKNRLW